MWCRSTKQRRAALRRKLPRPVTMADVARAIDQMVLNDAAPWQVAMFNKITEMERRGWDTIVRFRFR